MIKALEEEAREVREKILADSRAQANEILKEAEKKGEELALLRLEKASQSLRIEEAKILASANFDVRKEVLEVEEEVIGQLFTKLKRKAKQDLSSNEELFKSLAKEALSKFKGQKVKILVGEEDKSMAEKVLASEDYRIEGILNGTGGLKVISEDGRVTVDNTIDSRLKKIRHAYAPEIVKILFGDAK